ncbi:MAG: hypothetical protein GC203_21750 [Phenylobacterium sp.]|uniref:DUF6491 family protein n=1 Tax=Phenylobacterium sp. TaxID=1871053 RepID=UPI0025E6E04E|nr:DUF6491 family protein [Phenylobacterium sp.]MBI1200494.1 hypothetical protein [Phenylobacterium sp.]
MSSPRMTLTIAAAALVTAAGATAALAARTSPLKTDPPASGTGLQKGECIRSHDLRNHTIADDRTLLIRGRNDDVYRVTMAGNCLAGALPSDPIVTREPPGSPIICKPIDMDISIARNGFSSRCIVDSIVKMKPEEVAALPRRVKP